MNEIRVVAAAIVRDGWVLAALRSPTMPFPGCWELPGGKVDPGEGDIQALCREIREELAAEIEVGDRIGESVFDTETKRIRLVAYWATIRAGVPSAIEHSELRWLAADELDAFHWAPADIPLIELVRGGLSSMGGLQGG